MHNHFPSIDLANPITRENLSLSPFLPAKLDLFRERASVHK